MADEIPMCHCGEQQWRRVEEFNPLAPFACVSCGRSLEAALKEEESFAALKEEEEDAELSFLEGEGVGSKLASTVGDALMRGAAAKMAEAKDGVPSQGDGMAFFLGAMLKALGKSMDPAFQPDNHTSRLTEALHETLTKEGNLNGSVREDAEEGRGEGSTEGKEPARGSGSSGDAPGTGE